MKEKSSTGFSLWKLVAARIKLAATNPRRLKLAPQHIHQYLEQSPMTATEELLNVPAFEALPDHPIAWFISSGPRNSASMRATP